MLFRQIGGLSIVVKPLQNNSASQIKVADLRTCEIVSFLLKHRQNPHRWWVRRERWYKENNSQIVAISYRIMDS